MSIGPVVATATAYTVAIVSTAAASAADAAVVFDSTSSEVLLLSVCLSVCLSVFLSSVAVSVAGCF